MREQSLRDQPRRLSTGTSSVPRMRKAAAQPSCPSLDAVPTTPTSEHRRAYELGSVRFEVREDLDKLLELTSIKSPPRADGTPMLLKEMGVGSGMRAKVERAIEEAGGSVLALSEHLHIDPSGVMTVLTAGVYRIHLRTGAGSCSYVTHQLIKNGEVVQMNDQLVSSNGNHVSTIVDADVKLNLAVGDTFQMRLSHGCRGYGVAFQALGSSSRLQISYEGTLQE